ncbi:MAG: hypothetical protein U0871_01135 [Gemmataceae bacterium]
MFEYLRWETPMVERPFPVVHTVNLTESLTLLLISGDVQCAIRFASVFAFRVTDEQIPWNGTPAEWTTAIVRNSNWFSSEVESGEFGLPSVSKPCHYIVFGANWIAEILSSEAPEIDSSS